MFPLLLRSFEILPRRANPHGLNNWIGHVPFACDLVSYLRPKLLVELGTQYGESYFGLCQSVQEAHVECQCYAIDSWRGDEHSGFYPDVLASVKAYNEANYPHFSHLLEMTFDAALPQFADESIGLLHIDGLHTYEASKHDFFSWLPKVQPGGVILLHDIAVRHLDFGVWKLWRELEETFPSFAFYHSCGLGVVRKPGGTVDPFTSRLMELDQREGPLVRKYYRACAELLLSRVAAASRSGAPGSFAGNAQVFWPAEDGYAESESRTVALRANQWQKLYVEVRTGGPPGAIRLDPLDRPGLIEIADLAITSRGKPIWSLGSHNSDCVTVSGTAVRMAGDAPLTVFSFGSDPQMLLGELPPGEPGRHADEVAVEGLVRARTDLPGIAEMIVCWGVTYSAFVESAPVRSLLGRVARTNAAQGREDIDLVLDALSAAWRQIEAVLDDRTWLAAAQDEHRAGKARLEQELAAQRVRQAQAERELLEIRSSLCWRATAPLRGIARVLGYGRAGDKTTKPRFVLKGVRRRIESIYVRVISRLWRVHPETLFDRDFYTSSYPDVAVSGMDPLFHYLRYGAREGRNPHRFFETRYYLTRYDDVAGPGHNPLLHFLRFGAFQGRQPYPEFDSAWYLAVNSDVRQAGVNPLLHFLHHGAAEGRQTHAVWRSNGQAASYLPVSERPAAPAPDREIDVIVPVYKGLTETRACLESVLASANNARVRVVVVNDASPESELTGHLRQLADSGAITLVENGRNLGFVESVNRGMALSDRDVILLNSDTLVFHDWVDRLRACAYTNARVGTVTPFSNNATICSYPLFCQDNVLPPEIDRAGIDSACAAVNAGRSVEIPTAVGFCMYIRRDCLRDTGPFDAAAFGLGYGEENDFCMRSAARGWVHLLACDVFVYHAGAVSFGAASPRREEAMRILSSKHPRYLELVREHVEADPANAFRIAVTVHRMKTGGKRVFLAVTHALGGGTEQHLQELIAATASEVVWLILRPSSTGRAVLACTDRAHEFTLHVDSGAEYELLVTVARACGVERMHVHHLLGHTIDIARVIEDLNVPFDFTVHDYFAVCPQIWLTDANGRYCGEPGPEGCDRCIESRPPALVDILSWRSAHAWLLSGADRVIAPSRDIASRIYRFYPKARFLVAQHRDGNLASSIAPVRLGGNEAMRVAVLGVMAQHKGIALLKECAELAARSGLPLEFVLIGHQAVPGACAFRETGEYKLSELPVLLRSVAPHLVWFPARWPETYSYTLSACLNAGLPVAVPGIGAFPERVGGRAWSWVLPWDTSAESWIEFFLGIRRNHFCTGREPQVPPALEQAARDFYSCEYLTPAARGRGRGAIRHRAGPPDAIRIAAVVSRNSAQQIDACGYVRVIQPLTHPSMADAVQLSLTTPHGVRYCEADIVLVQRVAVQDMETARRIVDSCRRFGRKLVFEIDDDLFGVPEEHPGRTFYAAATEPAKFLARSADAVTTSTERLRSRLLGLNPNTITVPNYVDERLWLPAPEPGSFPAQTVSILYAGTTTHRDDLEFLGAAMRKARSRHGDRVQLDVVGVADEPGDRDWFNVIPMPHYAALSYPRFVSWIRDQNRWQWGVAPLLDSEFNRCKSPIKYLEYAALGLPGIYSDLPVYSDLVRDGESGLLAANDPDRWFALLDRVVDDADLWARLRAGCQAALSEHTLSRNAEALKRVWRDLAGGPPGAAMETAGSAAVSRSREVHP